jgi:uncharacterized membrane protein YwzB
MDNKLNTFIKASAIFLAIVSVMFVTMLWTNFQNRNYDEYRRNNPEQFMPAIYPGKVIEND